MPIRPATPDDADAIAAIYNDAIEHTTAVMYHTAQPASLWREKLAAERSPRRPFLVAITTVDGRETVAGFAKLDAFDPRCGYDDVADVAIYIGPNFRGQGIGRALLVALIDAGRAAQLHSILARITADNAASIKLHESLGFRPVGTYRQLGHKFGKRHDVCEYQIILDHGV
ncbi:MAG: GNAT family N-acetyltransferase [Phycisphaerales bacterium JB063]